nr:hypothetical protein [Burkholderia diffusa]
MSTFLAVVVATLILLRARFPMRRELALSRADKRGWVIDKDGARSR